MAYINIFGTLVNMTGVPRIAGAEQISTSSGMTMQQCIENIIRMLKNGVKPGDAGIDTSKLATQDDARKAAQSIKGFSFKIVDELPEKGESGVIYLVKYK